MSESLGIQLGSSTARFRPYPAYQSSGVPWLGDVPEHWQVHRLKTAAKYWVSNVDKIPAEDEEPIRLCNYTDVYYNERLRPDMGVMETTATAAEIERFGLRVGDVLVTKDSEEWNDIAIPAIVSATSPDFVCGYHLAIIRPNPVKLTGDFLLRALQSGAINQQFQIAATGVTRYGLPKGAIGEATLALPPLDEQKIIANFLDRETAKIDALLAKKQVLIEKLKEKRSALISRTVTRGLPPDAARAAGINCHTSLKSSSVNWLGEVPQHWKVTQLKYQAMVLDCKHITVSFVDDGIPVASIREVSDFTVNLSNAKQTTEDEYYQMIEGGRKPRRGDIIYSRNATVGDAALVNTDERFCLGQDVCLIRPLGQDPRFFLYLFRSQPLLQQVESLMIGSTFRRINVGQIKAFWVATPQLPEQSAIADYLDTELVGLQQMILKAEVVVSRLQEYRPALITSTVTGRIDVRGLA